MSLYGIEQKKKQKKPTKLKTNMVDHAQAACTGFKEKGRVRRHAWMHIDGDPIYVHDVTTCCVYIHIYIHQEESRAVSYYIYRRSKRILAPGWLPPL